MKKLLGVTLGIMTALGGFVDLGQIVFTTQAGALFGYSLFWAIVLGTAAIIVYMEMCGRVAVVAKEPVFSVVRQRLGFRLGLITLIASNLLNLITCAAEIGGIAIVLHLLTAWPEKLLLLAAALLLATLVLLLRFEWIERTFGLSGLLMIIFAVSAVTLHPDWGRLAHGLLPHMRPTAGSATLYWYFAVGIFSAMLMEYEVHFYSSGAIEEDWTPDDLGENFMVASFGSILGSLLTIGLLALGALIFLPRHIFPDLLSSAVFAGAFPFAEKALFLSLLGVLACIAGAAVETRSRAPTISASSSILNGARAVACVKFRFIASPGCPCLLWRSSSASPACVRSSLLISPSSSAWSSCLSLTIPFCAWLPIATSWANTSTANLIQPSASLSCCSSPSPPLPRSRSCCSPTLANHRRGVRGPNLFSS